MNTQSILVGRAGGGHPASAAAILMVLCAIAPLETIADQRAASTNARSADEYVRNDDEAEPDLAQADARVITLRVGADNIPKRGDLVDIMIDPDRIHLFDVVTGAKISPRSATAWLV